MPLEIHELKEVYNYKDTRSKEQKIEDELESIYCKVCGNFIGVKTGKFLLIGNVAIQSLPKGKVICGSCGKCSISQDYRAKIIQVKSRDNLLGNYFLGIIKYVVDNLWGQ